MSESKPNNDNARWILAVEQGVNASATYPLMDGRISLGRGLDCDLILIDEGLSDKHMSISVDGESISVIPEDGPIRIDDRLVEEETQVPKGASVCVGDTVIAFVPADDEAADETEGSENPAIEGEPGIDRAGLPASIADHAARRTRVSKLRAAVAVLAGAGGLALAVESAPDWAGGSQVASAKVPVVVAGLDPAVTRFEPETTEGTPDASRSSHAPDDRPDREAGRKLTAAVGELLAGLGLKDVEIRSAGSERVALRGLIPDDEARKNILRTIREDVPRVSSVDTAALKTAIEVADLLNGLIAESEFGNWVELIVRDGTLVAASGLPRSHLIGWDQVMEDAGHRLGFQVDPIFEEKQTGFPSLDIRSVWAGQPPYVELSDGEIYLEGAALSDGWVVDEIAERRVTLKKHGKLVSLNIDTNG